MNNEPVAWMHKNPDYPISKHWSQEYNIPLYTHPPAQQWTIEAKFKELTDEEIEECYWGDGYPDNPRHPKEFANAILRKAQEK